MKKPPPGGFCTFDHEGGQKFGHHRFLLRFQHMALDILPALLSQRERPWAIGPFSTGDSYGVLQAIHLEESLRWVPASSEMHAVPLRAWHG